jgi:hypothetical protein
VRESAWVCVFMESNAKGKKLMPIDHSSLASYYHVLGGIEIRLIIPRVILRERY